MWLFLSVASAATLTVGGSGYSSIQAAIDAASPGDEVVVDPGTWAGSVDFRGKAVTVRSRDGAGSTVIDAGGAWWTVLFQSGESAGAVLQGFTVQNASGAGIYVAGAPTLRDLVVRGVGVAGWDTPGLYVAAGSPTLIGSTFADNRSRLGAHLWLAAGTLSASGSTFSGGESDAAGAAYLAPGATLVGDGLAFAENAALYGHGGAIYAEAGAALTLVGGSLTANTAGTGSGTEQYGGAIFAGGATVALDGVELAENLATYGGAFFERGGTVTLYGATLRGNYATYGGAAFIDSGGALRDEGSTWDTNTGASGAGAVYGYYGWTADFVGSVFTENLSVYGNGGAIYGYYGTPTFTGVTFRDNLAAYAGGAMILSELYTTATLTDVTFERNATSYGPGGALYAQYWSHLALTRATFSGNRAYEGGALYVYYATDVTLADSLLSANEATLYEGGAMVFHQGAGGNGVLTVTGTEFSDNEAANEGGAIASAYADTLSIADSRFVRNEAGSASFGGAILALGPGTVVARRNVFANNLANYGGAVYLDAPTRGATFTNNRFQENVARAGGAFCLVGGGREVWTNNAFVGNSATEKGGVGCMVDTSMRFANNLVAWTGEGAALHDFTGETAGASEYAHNAFFANADGDASGAAPPVAGATGTLLVDPLVVAYTPNGDTTDDNLRLLRDSVLLDAGDPEVLDADGTRSDIGAYGGPDTWTGDADGDGWDASADCDDADPGVFPGAPETWYDGVNQDCAGASDYDQDGDGVDAAEGGGEDCDDLDPRRAEACGERPDGEDAAEGCGCASGGGGAGLGATLLALAALRRRGVTLRR